MKTALNVFLAMLVIFPMSILAASTYQQEPNPDEVGIYFSGVKVPLNRILLIRKDNHYCALKFIRAWIEMDEERLKLLANDIRQGGVIAESARESAEKKYADYESYSSKDGAPDFTTGRVQQKSGIASLLPLRGPFRPFVYQPGNGCVECDQFKLLWSYKTGVAFIPLGKGSNMRDYGFELGPTQWTDISQVNVFDPRVKWYRYNEKREPIFIPIDNLWEGRK